MEVVFANKLNENILENNITGFYGDINDLIKMGIDVEGLVYDDEWTVRRFLNGLHIKLNPRIEAIFNYIDLDKIYLNIKLKDLSKTILKYVLLAYLLLNNKKIIIFDYFEIGLTYKEQSKLVRILRTMKKDGITIIYVSKNLVFMDKIVDVIEVIKDGSLVFNGKIKDLITNDEKIVEETAILEFIKLANKKDANLEFTLDSKELLKDIYRSVC